MVGWQRQAETDAVLEFAQGLAYFAAQHQEDAELQRLSKRTTLIANKVALDEMVEIQDRKSICTDRLRDCATCRIKGQRTCHTEGCIYTTPMFKARAVIGHLGDNMLNQIRARIEAQDNEEEQ